MHIVVCSMHILHNACLCAHIVCMQLKYWNEFLLCTLKGPQIPSLVNIELDLAELYDYALCSE